MCLEVKVEAYEYLSEVYDKLMYDVSYPKWADYIAGFLSEKKAKKVLETACGTGKIAIELYRLGFDMTASDISPEMLRVASESSRKKGCDIRFILQDMRHIEVGHKIDAIISVCDGPNYLDTGGFCKFAGTAYEALNDNGVLIFDISSANKLKSMDGQVYYDDQEDASYIWHNAYDVSSGSLVMDITLFVRRGRLYERFFERHTQYAHEAETLTKILLSAGYKKIEIFDCFTKDEPEGRCQRAQFVCSK